MSEIKKIIKNAIIVLICLCVLWFVFGYLIPTLTEESHYPEKAINNNISNSTTIMVEKQIIKTNIINTSTGPYQTWFPYYLNGRVVSEVSNISNEHIEYQCISYCPSNQSIIGCRIGICSEERLGCLRISDIGYSVKNVCNEKIFFTAEVVRYS